MITLYPDTISTDKRGLPVFVAEAGRYINSLCAMAENLLGEYRLYPSWREEYAAFTQGYLHALRLDVELAMLTQDSFRLSQLVEDVEEVLRELQRRVNAPILTT